MFAQNIDCGYMLDPHCFLMSTHNLMFCTCIYVKIRKIVYPCIPQFQYIKVAYFPFMFFPDETSLEMQKASFFISDLAPCRL